MDGKKSVRKWFFVAATVFVILFGSLSAHADPLLIDFSIDSFTVTPGQTGVDVFGTLTNISDGTVYLNGDSISTF